MKLLFAILFATVLVLSPADVHGKELSGGQAANKALSVHPGKLLSVKPKNGKQGRYYVIRILKKDGRVKSVRVDAKTGRVK